MSDHERPIRRRSEGPVNPHPGADTPSQPSRTKDLHVAGKADFAAIRAAWEECHDLGLVSMSFPLCWRGAIETVFRLMAAEEYCKVCGMRFYCHDRGNPDCYKLQGKLPKLSALDLE